MWVANLYYWGFNQYVIQRALAAKSLDEAQKGIIFAASLKLIIPLIVVIPGIIVYVLYTQPEGTAFIPDRKSTRLNSSHVAISYAVFCLKKKKKNQYKTT